MTTITKTPNGTANCVLTVDTNIGVQNGLTKIWTLDGTRQEVTTDSADSWVIAIFMRDLGGLNIPAKARITSISFNILSVTQDPALDGTDADFTTYAGTCDFHGNYTTDCGGDQTHVTTINSGSFQNYTLISSITQSESNFIISNQNSADFSIFTVLDRTNYAIDGNTYIDQCTAKITYTLKAGIIGGEYY
jgi:hypothetical protein